MDRLNELLGPNEFLNSNHLQTALEIPPAKFIKLINDFDIPYYVDLPHWISDESAEIQGGGITNYLPSQSPVDISRLGEFKFHKADLRDAARTVVALQPLLEEVHSRPTGQDGATYAQLLAENVRLQEALKILADDIVGVHPTCPQDLVVVEAEDVSTSTIAACPEDLIGKLRGEGLTDPIKLAIQVDKAFPGLSYTQLGKLLPANPGAAVSYDAQKSRGQRLRGKK